MRVRVRDNGPMNTPQTDEQLVIVAEQPGRTSRGVLAIADSTPVGLRAIAKTAPRLNDVTLLLTRAD